MPKCRWRSDYAGKLTTSPLPILEGPWTALSPRDGEVFLEAALRISESPEEKPGLVFLEHFRSQLSIAAPTLFLQFL